MRASGSVPGSFRDPSGFLFYQDAVLYRQVNTAYKEHYDQLTDSGLYDTLVAAGLLIPHQEVDIQGTKPDIAYKIIRPEPIHCISYPYEWCFSQLKDAALTTLAIQKTCLDYGMSLKDCSAYNIQFRKGRPIFIDTLSFETYREGEPWVAYRQFCQHFLAPLALMNHTDVRLSQLFRVYIDGVPLDLASALLPVGTRFSLSLLSHIHLHARSQRHFADREVSISNHRVSRMAFLGLIDNLEQAVAKLKWQPRGTEWVDYEEEDSYSTEALLHKKEVVSQYLDTINPALVWDLGANIGSFSRMAADKDRQVVSFDMDPACVEKNYLQCVQEHRENILPVLLDLTNPSPGLGWQNVERMSLLERGPADAALALALIHHLAISNNTPFDKIAGFLEMVCNWLIIEFIPKADPQVQRLLSTREDIFSEYTQQAFESEFQRFFTIRAYARLGDSERTLYLMKKRGD